MPADFLSGAAARLLVAALTHQPAQEEPPLTATQLGQIAGITRKHTARSAARELVEAGYTDATLHPTPRLLSLLLLCIATEESVQALTEPGHDDGSREINKEIDSNTIYRRRAFVAGEGSSTSPQEQGVEGPKVQKVYPPDESTESVPEVRKVYSVGTESVLEVQKVYSAGTESVLPTSQAGTESVLPSAASAKSVLEGRPGSEEKQAHGVFEDSFAALLAADAMPVSTQVFPPDATYIRRHQSQMHALRTFWNETLPGKSATDQSLSMLLRTAGGVGERVADLIVACQERGIERPVGYIRAALTRQAAEREAKNPREQTWELELTPMTPAFEAQLEETQRQAALLWPEG